MRTVLCTAVTRNRLSMARAMFASVLQHNPEFIPLVLISDIESTKEIQVDEDIRILGLSDIVDIEQHRESFFYYSAFRLCQSLRPALLETALRETDAEACIYLDADILAYSSFAPILERIAANDIVLTPHIVQPLPFEKRDFERRFLQHGLFNSGFLGLRASERVFAFLRWWNDQLLEGCQENADEGLYVDQKWLDLVVVFWQSYEMLTHPGANVGYWNIHERPLRKAQEGYTAAGAELLFLHFSGWSYDLPQVFDARGGFIDPESQRILETLGAQFVEALDSFGFREEREIESEFARFSDGTVITPEMRQLFHELRHEGLLEGRSAFDCAALFRSRERKAKLQRRVTLAKRAFRLPGR